MLLHGERLGASLVAGLGRFAGQQRSQTAIAASALPHRDERKARTWTPATVGPALVLLAGHLDNVTSIAAELGTAVPSRDDPAALARLYGMAVLSWGDDADRRVIGEYSAIILNEDARLLRLARSPLRAPPLHYFTSAERVIAASVPRAIFACGIDRQLDEIKLADNALFNLGNEERGWFAGINRVPLGSVVELTPGGQLCRNYYDIAALPRIRRASTADYVAEAHELLREGTTACLAGSRKPAIMLSGGLDSALIAGKALEVMPEGAPLNAFTFVPESTGRGADTTGWYSDERPWVEAFCQKHPRIVPHFCDNANGGFDSRMEDLFFTTGGAPINQTNVAFYHQLWAAARAEGCDRILLGEFGNVTFSARGDWAYREYFRTLRWCQLYRALRGAADDGRPLYRRFITQVLMPMLPDSVWNWQRRVRGMPNIFEIATPLRDDYALDSGATARARAANVAATRANERTRLSDMADIHRTGWGGFSDIYHGFEQLHGITQRDPTAYRPFFEFCAGLPSELFLHDGVDRWLAREMGKGVLPEAQRLNRLFGRHNPDWHVKLSRRRSELLQELDRLERVPRLARMLDFAKVRAALEDWPEADALTNEARLVREGAIPRAFLLARYINYVEGRNLG